MNEIEKNVDRIVSENPIKIIISKPKTKNNEVKRIVIEKIKDQYQAEKFIDNQVFHENLEEQDLASFICQWLGNEFLQLNAFTESKELAIMISKKSKVGLVQRKHQSKIQAKSTHNKEKEYLFKEGILIEPLVDMGIFTRDGKVMQSMQDKYRQINRFIEVVDDVVSKLQFSKLNVVDLGCGKGYLTFLLYYYLTEIKGIDVRMIGVDLKKEVIINCNEAAKRYGYDGLIFEAADIRTFEPEIKPDLVVSLHACDTATDYVLANAIKWKSKMIFAMPCCQHELNKQISTDKFNILTRYGLLKENLSAILTDAIRANLLTYSGYKVQVLDIVNPMNTPKNILIRAVRSNIPQETRSRAITEVKNLTGEFNLKPTLVNLLQSKKVN